MSVLIKDIKMPMPERCWDCRFMDLQTGKCYADGSVRGIAKGYKRPADCPLLPVPDHGDLIDRDAWRKSLIDEGETIGIDGFSIDGLSADDVCYAIENAPVVIPAERSEE